MRKGQDCFLKCSDSVPVGRGELVLIIVVSAMTTMRIIIMMFQ